MARQTPESLLISALLNSQDPTAHVTYGVVSEHFFGYRSEFDWLLSFHDRFKRCPTKDEFLATFRDFPHSDTQDDVRWPATQVREEYSARTLSRALIKASADLKSGNIKDAFGHFKDLEVHTVVEKPGDLLVDYTFLDDYDKPVDKIAVPWRTLQGYTDGIGQGELWYVAARPAQGKSWTMLNMVAEAAMQGRTCIMYSLEMTKFQTQTRIHAILAHRLGIVLSQRDLASRRYDAKAYKDLLQQIEVMVPGTVHVHTPEDGPTTPAIVAARAGDYELNVVDYMGLMRSEGNGRAVDDWRVLAQISNDLKEIALAKNTRILAANQINREGDSNFSRKPPKLKHLSGSDAIGQDGDIVITMARPSQTTQVYSLEKNRHGQSSVLWWSRYLPDLGNFEEITRDTADDIRDMEDPE